MSRTEQTDGTTRVDPRSARTADALRTAVLDLAREGPVAEVGVSELCRRAGVSRDTFYRYAGSPLDLFARALDTDLAEITRTDRLPERAAAGSSVFEEPERQLLRLVADHAHALRLSMSPRLPSVVREVFLARMEAGLIEHLERHPGIVARALGDPEAGSDAFAVTVLAAYAASGTVGAIETWLLHGDVTDVDGAVRLVLAASPEWWHGR